MAKRRSEVVEEVEEVVEEKYELAHVHKRRVAEREAQGWEVVAPMSTRHRTLTDLVEMRRVVK